MTFECKKLNSDVCVSGQIAPEHINAIVNAGIKSIIINRPDGEKPDQTPADEIQKLAQASGVETCFVPMSPGQLSLELLEEMASALDLLPKPTLAYCASGTRSTILWCCVNVDTMGVDSVLQCALTAGYELEQIRPILTQLSTQND